MAKPQLVLLPGAWHTPLCMAALISKLEFLGYAIHTSRLPSVGNPNPPLDLSEDIAVVRSLVEQAIDKDNDVVVFPHSWAGIVTSSALVGLGKKEREAEGKRGGVVRTGYMASFILPEGVSLMDGVGGDVPSWWEVKGPNVICKSSEVLYSDLPTDEQKHWHSQLESHSLAALHTKTTGAAWITIPTSYLLCEDDLTIPASGQEAMTQGVKDMGGEIDVTRIKSGHSPFLSKLDETVEWVRQVAGE